MDAFIGWSGQRALAIAQSLKAWLQAAVPEVSFFVSTDLPKGKQWLPALSRELRGAQLGLMCLAPPQGAGDWQLVEAGAIWKAGREGGVFPLCFGVKRSEVPEPLTAFQLTQFNRNEFLQAARDLVAFALGDAAWTDERRQRFEAGWPAFEAAVQAALAAPDAEVATPRGFMHAVAGGWWERLRVVGDSTKLSWMRVIREDDGARLSINGDGFDDAGQPAATWRSHFVALDKVADDYAELRYYWEGRHEPRKTSRDAADADLASQRFGGVGSLTFFIDADHRVCRGKGEFTDVCLSSARAPAVKSVELRRATEADAAVMNGSDAKARRELLRRTVKGWD